jgi:hypothetical protein
VTITVCPPACAERTREGSRPEEQPLISQVSCFFGVVNVANVLADSVLLEHLAN